MSDDTSVEFSCPICAAPLLDEDGLGSCPHLQFAYHSSIGEFLATTPEIDNLLPSMTEDSESVCDYITELKSKLPKSITVYDIDQSGMACGPVWATIWIGIKGTEQNEQLTK